MYNDVITRGTTMGDVDVLWHEGVYHLFHLVLPNHDFVAHAVSDDGLSWTRVENAIFIGNPGEWDDHMLWTMHVSPDPHRAGAWRMFYTGLSRHDRGTVQRLGMARSRDLHHWQKVSDCWDLARPQNDGRTCRFPLAAANPHYEERPHHRPWVSFRDPFYYRDNGVGMLLMAARTNEGPTIRRGCVGMADEVAPDRFELRKPLHQPGQYDDIEVPNLVKLDGRYYLVGSIREDAKIRYWWSKTLDGPWSNFYDNVLLAEGNYAGRISRDDRGPLIWNFYTPNTKLRSVMNLMPPPKRLSVAEDGRIRVRSFEGFEAIRNCGDISFDDLQPLRRLVNNEHASADADASDGCMNFRTEAGFEGFLFAPEVHCFRFSARFRLDGLGKCGIVFRVDDETSDGYYLSLDLLKGVAQLRAWGHRESIVDDEVFRFQSLQSGYWRTDGNRPHDLTLLVVGSYIELSIDGDVLLSLADETYSRGRIGCYVESSCLRVERLRLEHLRSPQHPTAELPGG